MNADDPLDQAFDLLADGREGEALDQLGTLIREEPWNGPLLSLRALVLVDLGRPAEAAEDARAGVEMNGEHPFTHYAAAAVALALARHGDAIEAARQAQVLQPEFLEARMLEARAHAAMERWPEAAELTRQILASEPENEEAALLHTVASGALLGGQLDEATWRSLAERFPLNPIARAGAGWTRLSAGEARDARVQFEQALALDPTLPWAREGLLLALKAQNPVYGALYRALQWLGQFPRRTRTLLILGGFLGFRLLRGAAETSPGLKPFIYPLLAVYLAFVLLSWLADPLLHLLLMLKPEGRRLLDEEQRDEALQVAACLGTGVVLAAGAALLGWSEGYQSAFAAGFTSLAVSAAYRRGGRRRTQLRWAAGIAFGLGLGAGIPGEWSTALFGCSILLTAISTWVSSLGSEG